MLRSHRFAVVMLWAVSATLIMTNPVHAYVGPGAGMEFLTYAMGLVAMVGVAFFSILMWPFYAFLRWVRGSGNAASPAALTTPLTPASPALPAPTAAEAVHYPAGSSQA